MQRMSSGIKQNWKLWASVGIIAWAAALQARSALDSAPTRHSAPAPLKLANRHSFDGCAGTHMVAPEAA